MVRKIIKMILLVLLAGVVIVSAVSIIGFASSEDKESDKSPSTSSPSVSTPTTPDESEPDESEPDESEPDPEPDYDVSLGLIPDSFVSMFNNKAVASGLIITTYQNRTELNPDVDHINRARLIAVYTLGCVDYYLLYDISSLDGAFIVNYYENRLGLSGKFKAYSEANRSFILDNFRTDYSGDWNQASLPAGRFDDYALFYIGHESVVLSGDITAALYEKVASLSSVIESQNILLITNVAG